MPPSATSAPNLLLVTVDCLRADHVGFHGYGRPTTPVLDRLAADAWRFERAIPAGIPTYYSFPAIQAGRPPLAHGRDVVGLAPGEPTLATTLRDAGYRTAAFTAGNPYLTRRDGYDQGFDTFVDFLTGEITPQDLLASEPSTHGGARRRLESTLMGLARPVPWARKALDELRFQVWTRRRRREEPPWVVLRRYPSADEVAARSLAWLKSLDGSRPFFLWLHFMDPHHPYYPPPEAHELLGTEVVSSGRAHNLNALWCRDDVSVRRHRRIRQQVVDLYDAGVRWVDHQLGRVVEALEELGAWDRTLFAFTGDHGEEFLERGGRYHSPFHLHRELNHVPLVIREPGGGSGTTLAEPTALTDLPPTLLGRLGIDTPETFVGMDRLAANGSTDDANDLDGVVVTEVVEGRRNPWQPGDESGHRLMAAEIGSHKLVAHLASGEQKLFDLAADPDERHPLADSEAPEIRARLNRALLAHLRRSHHRRGESTAILGNLEVLRRRWQKQGRKPALDKAPTAR